MTMHIIICGAGSTGRHAAEVLGEIHEVTVIDRLPERRVPGHRFVGGDAADPAVLLEAGAPDADALVAATADDPTNLVIVLLAKRHFGVGSTVARMRDPAHRWLFTAAAGVDVVVSAAELLTRLLQEEVTAGDLVTLLELRGGGVAVTETTVPAGAAAAGHPVAELAVPDGTALTAIIRADQVLLPGRAGALQGGDTVVALCEPGREHALHDLLTAG
jgi:trk system potassium uptake protein TrkA